MATSKPHFGQTVLVVEDDQTVRMLAVEVIEDAGFEVIQAISADEAISILENRLDIRLVFSDINLPGSFDGIRLAAYIHDRWPQIEIILTSGKYFPKKNEFPPRVLFISKPYRLSNVVKTLQKMVH